MNSWVKKRRCFDDTKQNKIKYLMILQVCKLKRCLTIKTIAFIMRCKIRGTDVILDFVPQVYFF